MIYCSLTDTKGGAVFSLRQSRSWCQLVGMALSVPDGTFCSHLEFCFSLEKINFHNCQYDPDPEPNIISEYNAASIDSYPLPPLLKWMVSFSERLVSLPPLVMAPCPAHYWSGWRQYSAGNPVTRRLMQSLLNAELCTGSLWRLNIFFRFEEVSDWFCVRVIFWNKEWDDRLTWQ